MIALLTLTRNLISSSAEFLLYQLYSVVLSSIAGAPRAKSVELQDEIYSCFDRFLLYEVRGSEQTSSLYIRDVNIIHHLSCDGKKRL